MLPKRPHVKTSAVPPDPPWNLRAARLAFRWRVASVAMAEQNGKGPVAALFDVDGTLVDTNYLHAVTWWEAFTQAGYQVPMARIQGGVHRRHVWDVQACQKAGVPCIGVLSGGVSRDELTSAGAAEVYRDPAGLLAALDGSLLGSVGETA